MSFDSPAADPKRKKALEDALAAFTKHLDTKEYAASQFREDCYFRRAQVLSTLENFAGVDKDVAKLLEEFPDSPNKGDYLMLRGRTESLQVFRAMSKDKKTKAEGAELAKKPLATLDLVLTNEKSAVIKDDAYYQTAELYFLVADGPEDYQKALAAYRHIKPKQELLPIQEALLKEIGYQIAEAAKARNQPLSQKLQLRRQKEQGRLMDLKNGPDHMIESLIQTAQCYIRTGKPNEARVVLRRAKPYVPKDDQKLASFLTILTYSVQKGMSEKAAKAFEEHQKEFPGDDQADNISIMIANELMTQKDFEGALAQLQKNLKEYPKGRYADLATLKLASCLVGLKRPSEGIKTLEDFVAKNATSPNLLEAQFSLAQAYLDLGQLESAIKVYRSVVDNPKAEGQAPNAQLQIATQYLKNKKFDEAIKEFETFKAKFGTHEQAPAAIYSIAHAQMQKNNLDAAIAAVDELIQKHPKYSMTPSAALLRGQLFQRQSKFDEMIKAYEKVAQDYTDNPTLVINAQSNLAKYYERNRIYDKADKHYQVITAMKDPKQSPWSLYNNALMHFNAGKTLGAFTALTDEEKKQWTSYTSSAEKYWVEILKTYPESEQIGQTLSDLLKLSLLKADYKILTDDQASQYFTDLAKEFSDPSLSVRIQLAAAGIPYERGKFNEALKTFKSILSANPKGTLSADDFNRYGTALFKNKEYDASIAVFQGLEQSYPADKFAQANAIYGQGAALLFKGQASDAGIFFAKLKKEYGWSDKIMEAEYGIGFSNEEAKKFDDALASYALIIKNPKSTTELKAKSMMGYGRIHEAKGMLLPDPAIKDQPSASAYYLKIDGFFENEKLLASEALWRAGQIYEKAGKPEDARKCYVDLKKKYSATEWAPKAEERLRSLPAPSK